MNIPRRGPVGITKTQGWEIGVRRTLPVSADDAWQVVMTPPGIGYWLGDDLALKLARGAVFTTRDGTTGEIRSLHGGTLIRLRWQRRDWPTASTLQIRIIPAGSRATISIHHEHLPTAQLREEMRSHWTGVLEQFKELMGKAADGWESLSAAAGTPAPGRLEGLPRSPGTDPSARTRERT